MSYLTDECRDGRAVVLEAGFKLAPSLVVARETVDTGFDENEAEFGVLVLAVNREVLADSIGLLEEVGEILRVLRSKA